MDQKLDKMGNPSIFFSNISINNKEVGGLGGGGQLIDEYSEKYVTKCNLFGIKEDELKGDVDIKICFDEAITSDDKVIKGPWVFEFKADGKALALDTEEIKINKSIELEDGSNLILEKYTKNNMGEKIYTRIDGYN